ncbi:pyridoxamine 5'-phosphate oxidase family protein [Sharpea azabuensis]|uniref:Uncharacterized protein, pyridoxamine 5'-phosphate oxidase (PNPOx-like) family n=1 Tax=Sharpea azabuensis TaxID=322505 RepID=A0A1H6QDS3_9FIRM|nr:pyridoxamine 5'-phosphate oxidase family protein [Sharpea azabuensis]HAJ15805.1 NimC/NimA family protein [Erysipelotrichaceae bacterium]MDD6511640.1 pyridoxamine 5'-phosphate oxidase family protein [Sharpea azabuensis]MEE3308868.1 pyridoxamine 5'-phosphate oxidase family protein [Sharpea azabuensis]SEI41849.1 Uncharacterized protein, pyridoxamine 5'-phosphate oxidase (PNPOx-like) family [Sharpea azabuensis]HBZ88234.1 NimC/NimA family protein [Erysipelotrichaceae bacterium]
MNDKEKVLEFLNDAKVWYLATVDDEGNPHVRPFGAQAILDDKLYIQTGLKKNVAKQMLAHPQVEISGMAEGKWIRLEATVVHDDRVEQEARFLDAVPSLKKMYAAGDGNTAIFYLKDAHATICSFTEAPETYDF